MDSWVTQAMSHVFGNVFFDKSCLVIRGSFRPFTLRVSCTSLSVPNLEESRRSVREPWAHQSWNSLSCHLVLHFPTCVSWAFRDLEKMDEWQKKKSYRRDLATLLVQDSFSWLLRFTLVLYSSDWWLIAIFHVSLFQVSTRLDELKKFELRPHGARRIQLGLGLYGRFVLFISLEINPFFSNTQVFFVNRN